MQAFWCMSNNPKCVEDILKDTILSIKPNMFVMKFAQYFKNPNKMFIAPTNEMSQSSEGKLDIPLVDI